MVVVDPVFRLSAFADFCDADLPAEKRDIVLAALDRFLCEQENQREEPTTENQISFLP